MPHMLSVGVKSSISRAFVFTFLLAQSAAAATIEISIPYGSQAIGRSRPSDDQTWDVTAQNGTFNDTLGIGIIIDPTYPIGFTSLAVREHEFALHQNNDIPGSDQYTAPHIPYPVTSTVTFLFDRPTIVRGFDLVQHLNGVTEIGGAAGYSLSSLQLIGSTFGPSGDQLSGFVVPYDGFLQRFDFGNQTVAGTIFQLTIEKSVHPSAYALFRAFPFDQNGDRILPVVGAAPAPAAWTMMLLGLGGFGALLYRRKRRPAW